MLNIDDGEWSEIPPDASQASDRCPRCCGRCGRGMFERPEPPTAIRCGSRTSPHWRRYSRKRARSLVHFQPLAVSGSISPTCLTAANSSPITARSRGLASPVACKALNVWNKCGGLVLSCRPLSVGVVTRRARGRQPDTPAIRSLRWAADGLGVRDREPIVGGRWRSPHRDFNVSFFAGKLGLDPLNRTNLQYHSARCATACTTKPAWARWFA